jgi:RNA polymerase sigma-70 factor, ECF subfamily
METINCTLLTKSSDPAGIRGRLGEEALLIHRILAGQQDRFQELLQPHMGVILRTVQTKMRNHAEVDDVIQETLLKALTRLTQFRFEASFRTWLVQIAINESRQWYRRRMSIPNGSTLAEQQLIDASPSPLEECQRQESSRSLHHALSKLPEIYQDVVRLRDMHQLSISETARLLRLSIPAVKTRHRRGRLLMMRFVRRQAVAGVD